MGAALLSLLSLLACLSRSDAIWVYNAEKYVPANGAVFIGKFCYDYDTHPLNKTGELELRILGSEPATGEMKFVLLNDQQESYPDTNNRWPGFDCDDKRLHAAARTEYSVALKNLKSNSYFHTFIVERLRPRYWFLAAIDCSGIARTIKYDLHMANIEQGFQKEISMDHCGLTSLCLFLAVFAVTGLIQTHATFLQNGARTKHPLRLLLGGAIWSAMWGMGFYTLDTTYQAIRGEESTMVYLAAKLCKATSKFTLLLILVLLSKGRGISRDLHTRDVMYGAIVVAPFLTVCLGLELWGEYDQSRMYTTNFLYDTWIGGFLVFSDIVLLCLYASNLLRSYHGESIKDKKAFYRTWGCVYSSAFLNLPLTAFVALWIAPYVRIEAMFILSNAIHALLLTLLVAGLWPSRAQSAFCIDKGTELACTFGAQAGSLLDEDVKAGSGYQDFNMDDGLADGNI